MNTSSITRSFSNFSEVALIDVPSCLPTPTKYAPVITNLMQSIVRVSISVLENAKPRSATAWYLGNPQENFEYFLTNYHVTHPKDKETHERLTVSSITLHVAPSPINVYWRHVERMSEDSALDYCIFRINSDTPINNPRLVAKPISRTFKKGDTIANIGFPMFSDELKERFPDSASQQNFSISKVHGTRAEFIYHTTFTLHGSSGSILFDPENGDVLALHTVSACLFLISRSNF